MKQQTLCVLGSTGSIGENTLDVVARNPEHFRLLALAAHRNAEKLAQQCARFDAELAVIADPTLEPELAAQLQRCGSRAEILSGQEGLIRAATLPEVDTVMAAIVGAVGASACQERTERHGRRLDPGRSGA